MDAPCLVASLAECVPGISGGQNSLNRANSLAHYLGVSGVDSLRTPRREFWCAVALVLT